MGNPSPRRSPFLAIFPAFLAAILASCVSSGELLADQVRIQERADETAKEKTEIPTKEPGTKDPAVKGKSAEENRLTVKGDPPGASVYQDGEFAGTSPLAAPLKPGFHEIRVEYPGYRSFEYSVFHDGRGDLVVEYELARITGVLDISAFPEDAEIRVDGGGRLGQGAHELPVGEHEVTANRFGYETERRSVSIREGECVRLEMTLAPAPLRIEPILSGREFNPREAGSLGRIWLGVLPNSFGYASIKIIGPDGASLAEYRSPHIETGGILEMEWDGKDRSGALAPEGEYRVLFESWSMRQALPGGLLPETVPDGSIEERIKVGRKREEYANMLGMVSGSSYCPSGVILGNAGQFSLSAQGTFLSPEQWLGQILLCGRTGIVESRVEGDSTVGLICYPGIEPRFVLGLGFKGKVWEAEKGSLRFSSAFDVKANFFSDGIVVDPFGVMRGVSAGLPVRLGWGILGLDLCPELCLSPYLPNVAESAVADIFGHPWNAIPYLRGAWSVDAGAFSGRLSGFYRFAPRSAFGFVPDPPLGLALDCVLTDMKRGVRYGISALGQFQDLENFYFLLGVECGVLFRPYRKWF